MNRIELNESNESNELNWMNWIELNESNESNELNWIEWVKLNWIELNWIGMLAKVCSDRNKPNGQFVLANSKEAVMDFVRDLPIRKISGIGNVTEQLLANVLDVSTCADLYRQRHLISLLFSEISCHHFMRVALGIASVDHSVRFSKFLKRIFRQKMKNLVRI